MEEPKAAAAELTLSSALEGYAEALTSDAEQTATGASEILDVYFGQPQALLLLMSALKVLGMDADVHGVLESMVDDHPKLAALRFELGNALYRLGEFGAAAEHLSRVVELEPNHPTAWRALGNALARTGDKAGMTRSYARHLRASLRELRLLEDTVNVAGDESVQAENMLRQAVDLSPTDVATTRALGRFYLQMGRLKDAEATLRRALELAPDCSATRQNYCLTLIQQMRWKEANIQLKILMEEQPDNPRFSAMLATNLVMLGERDEGMRVLADAKSSAGQDAAFWQHYAHAARMAGEGEESIIDAFRKCVALDPAYGSAWWGLADLKTYRFSPAEITTLKEQLSREDLSPGHRCYMEFTYGSALENAGEFSQSFEHYAKANALRRPFIVYHADATHQDVQNLKKLFTTDFFEARRGVGCPAPDPIFIVGMPRAGSTLVEQVLSSHSLVEGTMELPDLGNIVGELVQKHAPQKPFPTFLADLDAETLRRLGEDYLQRTQPQRKLGKPYFTDKTGSNFLHSGLIQLILPNAKIVDARRHPLACGFSCYKQAFGPGALHLAYDQTDIGRYYRDYVDMMAHYDKVLPGRVHRVIHEKLTLDPEREIRRLLDYCGLPFEEQCLRSHETKRSVRTASSQQVRQPIQKKKVEAWEHYAPWLQPMRDALGDVLTSYPDVPAFD